MPASRVPHALLALLLITLITTVGVAPTTAAEIDEGIDYVRVADPLPPASGAPIEVLEFFWYGCPHCWNLEPALKPWIAQLPEDVRLRQLPALSPRWITHARAFFAARLLDRLDDFHPALFAAMHEQGRMLLTEAQLTDFAVDLGLDRAAFQEAFHSAAVDTLIMETAELSQRFDVVSVPTFIVAGQYRTGPTMTVTHERLFQVIDSLVDRERAAAADSD